MTADPTFSAAAVHHRAGRFAEAEALYRQVLASDARHADALHLLGIALHQQGKSSEAVSFIERAVALRPDAADFHSNLGLAQGAIGMYDQAIATLRRALTLKPHFAEAYCNLGVILMRQGRLGEAEAATRSAIAICDTLPDAHNNLGAVLLGMRRPREAIASFERAVSLAPKAADVHYNASRALRELGQIDSAILEARRAIELNPRHSAAWNYLGSIIASTGDIEDGIRCVDRSLALTPDAMTGSNRLGMLWYSDQRDAAALHREHRRWNDQYATPVLSRSRFAPRTRLADKKLRVGYLSPYLTNATTGWNLQPLLRNHDRDQFDVFCYAASASYDKMTERLAECCNGWRQITEIEDDAAAEMIRADGIDILVDLVLHATGARPLIFARKPAPVQVTYLGYCGTTGMDAIDYRLSDPYFDPPGSDVSCYSEQTVRLPHCYWCYEAGGPLAEVGPLPALAAGHVTFGSMNQFSKISPTTRAMMVRVLRQVPGSRLLIYSPPGSHRDRLVQLFLDSGTSPDRIEFVPRQSWDDYINTYNRIDIALDSIPYNGGITSCDALSMGVPFVTLRGGTSVGRAGCSILNNVGLPELIAETPEQYVKIAAELAWDLARLAELRAGMRERLVRSPLRDAKGFARDVEAAYRKMWEGWRKA